MTRNESVLVIAGFGMWVDGDARVSKIETHIQPIADAAGEVEYVCCGPTSDQTVGISYRQVTESRFKPVTLVKQALLALWLVITNDYNLIVSFSLLPYGVIALGGKYLTRTPAHLGIIGGDLDVHATAWYGVIIRWLFRRFDVVTVAGRDFAERLLPLGVPQKRIFTVLHPVGKTFSEQRKRADPRYDILWLTRMTQEKDPLLFVDILAELRERSVSFSAAMVGTGAMDERVRRAIAAQGLQQVVDLPGWANDPAEYYRDARIYVMTSSREMLPLTLVEAMLVGVPPVVPAVGAIPDIINSGTNGIVIPDRSVKVYADAIEQLLTDDSLYSDLASQAPHVEADLSYEAVAESWEEIFDYLAGDSFPAADGERPRLESKEEADTSRHPHR